MRRLMFASFVAGMFALMSMLSVPAVAADPDEPKIVRLHVEFSVGETPYFWGSVGGDLTGWIAYTSDPSNANWVSGKVMHFYELFTIFLGSDPTPRTEPMIGEDYITGVNAGTWNLKTWSFVANGYVIDASGDYEYLVGYDYHEAGETTDPSGAVIDGVGNSFMAPP